MAPPALPATLCLNSTSFVFAKDNVAPRSFQIAPPLFALLSSNNIPSPIVVFTVLKIAPPFALAMLVLNSESDNVNEDTSESAPIRVDIAPPYVPDSLPVNVEPLMVVLDSSYKNIAPPPPLASNTGLPVSTTFVPVVLFPVNVEFFTTNVASETTAPPSASVWFWANVEPSIVIVAVEPFSCKMAPPATVESFFSNVEFLISTVPVTPLLINRAPPPAVLFVLPIAWFVSKVKLSKLNTASAFLPLYANAPPCAPVLFSNVYPVPNVASLLAIYSAPPTCVDVFSENFALFPITNLSAPTLILIAAPPFLELFFVNTALSPISKEPLLNADKAIPPAFPVNSAPSPILISPPP